jgi:hypothetical protein
MAPSALVETVAPAVVAKNDVVEVKKEKTPLEAISWIDVLPGM